MAQELAAQAVPRRFAKSELFSLHSVVLITTWLITTAAYIYMLFDGVRNTGYYRSERDLIQVQFVLILCWYLIRTGPAVKQLPNLKPVLLPRRRIGMLIPVIILAALLLSEFYDQGLLLLLMILATIWLLIAWRREIGLRSILLGLAVMAIACWAGWAFYENNHINSLSFFGLLILAIPMFVVGGLLSKRSGLVGSQLYAERYREALKSFLWGCLLFVPLGLSNAAAGSPGRWMTWVDRGWMPFTQPLFSGMVEEIWYRLLLVSLCYFLLRPGFKKFLPSPWVAQFY